MTRSAAERNLLRYQRLSWDLSIPEDPRCTCVLGRETGGGRLDYGRGPGEILLKQAPMRRRSHGWSTMWGQWWHRELPDIG